MIRAVAVALAVASSPVHASETPTQWYYRAVPTSLPAFRCANGRTPHLKFPVDTWKDCSTFLLGHAAAKRCRGAAGRHWRVPLVWCPGPQAD